jgi:hypothetical protein
MKDLSKLINKMIDKAIIGCDKYVHNHSTWLIFTDEKKWVIELTNDGTLWYNYNFFKNLFKVLSLDVVENQNYITKWVEDTIINGVRSTKSCFFPASRTVEDAIINGVNYTGSNTRDECHQVEDTIQNGVKHTSPTFTKFMSGVEETIQNGVKETKYNQTFQFDMMKTVENTIENGVKETEWINNSLLPAVEDAIENGVKHTRLAVLSPKTVVEDTIENGVRHTMWSNDDDDVEDTIQNGVKHTEYGDWLDGDERFDDIIQNGVKDTKNLRVQKITMVQPTIQKIRDIEDTIQNGVKETHSGCDLLVDDYIEDTIQNGVKEIHWVEYSNLRSVEDTIQNGVKETHRDAERHPKTVKDTIQNGVKETKTPGEDGDILGALDFLSDNNTVNIPQLIDDVIKNGVKRTEGGMLFDETKVDRIISEGVKETKGGGYLGSIEMKGKIIHQLESPKQNNEVEEVIEHGVKLTNSSLQIDGSCVVEDVIQNGIKETHDDVYHHKGRVGGVIKNGVKEVKPSYIMKYNPMNFEPVISEEKRIPDVTDVIRDGIKETKPIDYSDNTEFIVDGVINRGTSI